MAGLLTLFGGIALLVTASPAIGVAVVLLSALYFALAGVLDWMSEIGLTVDAPDPPATADDRDAGVLRIAEEALHNAIRHAAAQQITIALAAAGGGTVLSVADDGLTLARARTEFGVGVVLENILAEQDQTRARFDYVRAIGEYDKAQYGLARALGRLDATPAPTP